MLVKKTPTGEIRYRNLQWVCLVSETHYTRLGGLKAMPVIEIEGPTAAVYPRSTRTLDELRVSWVAHCGQQLFEATPPRVSDAAFRSFTADSQDNPSTMAAHEVWRRQYRAKPYLSGLNAEELREYAIKVFQTLKPYFLRGEEKPTDAVAKEYMAWFTHLLEEVSIRGVDMRQTATRPPVNLPSLAPFLSATSGTTQTEARRGSDPTCMSRGPGS